MLKLMGKKCLQFYAENFCLSKPVGVKGCSNQNSTCVYFRFNPIREGMKTVEADEIWQLLYKHVNNNYSSFKQAFLQFDIVSIL